MLQLPAPAVPRDLGAARRSVGRCVTWRDRGDLRFHEGGDIPLPGAFQWKDPHQVYLLVLARVAKWQTRRLNVRWGQPRVSSTLTSGGARCQGDHLALLFVPATIGTAARATDHPLQTLDGGVPVSLKTVQAEMGHSSFELIERIYSHLPADRPRLEVLEYRPSPADVLADINSRLA